MKWNRIARFRAFPRKQWLQLLSYGLPDHHRQRPQTFCIERVRHDRGVKYVPTLARQHRLISSTLGRNGNALLADARLKRGAQVPALIRIEDDDEATMDMEQPLSSIMRTQMPAPAPSAVPTAVAPPTHPPGLSLGTRFHCFLPCFCA